MVLTTTSKAYRKLFPDKLTALLYYRFRYFNGAADKGLIMIPCELIEKNGETLRDTILQYIQHWNLPDAFRQWIVQHNIFCNTLVDRIVPGYPADSISEVEKETGYHDKLVVMAEPFYVWVIEGPEAVRKNFPAEAAGLNVKFVNDLTPYRTQKVRILNGAHTAMVPVAYLKGLRTVKEAMDDQDTARFIQDTIEKEIIPGLNLPDEDLHPVCQRCTRPLPESIHPSRAAEHSTQRDVEIQSAGTPFVACTIFKSAKCFQ